MSIDKKISRRQFLKTTGAIGSALPWALNLASIADVAAATGVQDYKALVCVFLFGGNDHANTVIPYDAASHQVYDDIRKGVAIKRADVLTLNSSVGLPSGMNYGLHPNLKNMQTIFNQNKLAVQLNVGALFTPTTLAEYKNKSVPLPPRLFSHNDQQSIWQASKPEGAIKGWGGAIAEATRASYGKSLFTSVSLHGNAVFLAGDDVSQYQCTGNGAIPIRSYENQYLFGSKETAESFRKLIDQASDNPFKKEMYNINQRSIRAYAQLAPIKSTTVLGEFDEKNRLAKQLKYVAQMIKENQALGVKRQVFFVGVGGYDSHADLLAGHSLKMAELDSALGAFHTAISGMGMDKQVTTFTASDFGRTLSSNGDGSDHGWGSHHFIMGGAVKGGRFYGQMPDMGLKTNQDVGRGRLLPSVSVDQYATTFATWFGVQASDMALIAPNIGNFNDRDLGFLDIT